jgi:hypothetical protein
VKEVYATMAIRRDLDGLRVKSPTAPSFYLIDEGKKRAMHEDTFQAVFNDWSAVQVMDDVNNIDNGDDLTDGTVCITSNAWPRPEDATVYLLDVAHRVKRAIESPGTVARYGFYKVWNKVPPCLLDFVPDGPGIRWPEA